MSACPIAGKAAYQQNCATLNLTKLSSAERNLDASQWFLWKVSNMSTKGQNYLMWGSWMLWQPLLGAGCFQHEQYTDLFWAHLYFSLVWRLVCLPCYAQARANKLIKRICLVEFQECLQDHLLNYSGETFVHLLDCGLGCSSKYCGVITC